ncbi:Asp23/Gls24 family envelope stress response protein [Modestobacter sp. Leaf380]|uniref:Asp23/Gls24 family envelope stress response protein n=1 Tax=Modestobacter sp. Leaf380 TaxID=1736356 RepID=UPI0012F8FD39|nr:Asp23/Gls24 family envelope stress response protein [Modestobacter sp. Leaf380]
MTVPGRALVGGVDPRVVAAAVLACPGVVRLSGGPFGSAATYLPGDRVTGVVVRETDGPPDVAVHVVSLYGVPVADVAGQVRTAVTAAAPGSRVDVHVDDVDHAAPPVEDPVPPAGPPAPGV